MSLFALYHPCANLTQQDYRTLILSSDSGAKWIRGYESLSSNCLANVDLNTACVSSLRGETAAPAIEHIRLKAAVREKTRRWPCSTHRHRTQLANSHRGVDT